MIQSRTLSKKGKMVRDNTARLNKTPPSSRGPGRGPLKAQTGVRIPMGAQKESLSQWLFSFHMACPKLRVLNVNTAEVTNYAK